MNKPNVIVIGAGTGGLALAHGLRAAGISVRVFERDRSLADRPQGYRLTINGNGARALEASLPKENFEHYISASSKVSTAVSFLDHRMRRLLKVDVPNVDQNAPYAARPISRISLREILAEGLEDTITWGRTFQSFERVPAKKTIDERVIARFEDGSSVEADVMIGADGAASRIRRQLLPHAERIDTGIVMISGKLPLDATVRRDAPPAIFQGPTLIPGPRGCCMFAGAVEYPPGHSPAYDREEYVTWGFSAHRDSFGLGDTGADITFADPRAAVLAQMPDWSRELRDLVERADAATLTVFAVRSSVPVAPWQTTRITLLGDALHNMTPFRGIGANTALRDAVSLRNALLSVDRGERDLLGALAQYEREMIDYGFAAVRASLANMNRMHARSRVTHLATRVFFRFVELSPWLGRRMITSGN
jgi:2-polyprenyl-6-methoxyphenol hydroxylase-like FAD-dependent oxidoreductase